MLRQAQKKKKKIHSEYHFCLTRFGAFLKKFKTLKKKKKNVILVTFLDKPSWDKSKKIEKKIVLGNVSS